ncbi:MAG TPA: zinc ribbon domain-containing protein [Gammaproteobacteria bacterium]|nr:zinc ribbon domain-containing protein [Gammaproteobacteria bacterium]
MPTYDYACEENGRVVEVQHRMSEVITTWGELCERAGIDLGHTAKDAPVKKLATGGQVVRSSSLGESAPPCASGGCGRSCGL